MDVKRSVKNTHGGRPVQVFTRYHEKDITRRPHVYGEKSKLTKGVIGYDANALYISLLFR